jgi:hypothetical protein
VKKIILLIILVLFAVSCSKDDLTARVISILKTEGESVTLRRGSEEAVTAREGLSLSGGSSVSTGADSFCYITLDAESLLKMDENSAVFINNADARSLRLTVDKGQVLIDVHNRHDSDSELTVRVGGSTLAVRGTLFVAGFGGGGQVTVIMLEGSADVDGTALEAGYMAQVSDGETDVKPIILDELDRFAIQSIIDNQTRVIEAGTITRDGAERLPDLLEGTVDITRMLVLGGMAVYNEDNSILLCPAVNWGSGTALFPHELPDNFMISYDFKIGGGTGADGIVCAFFAPLRTDTAAGGDLNFRGGYGIELDTFRNVNDSPNPHIALIHGTASNHLVSVDDTRVGDGEWHRIVLRVNGNTVTVTLGGDTVIEYTGEIDRTERNLYFTATTGGSTNDHYIRNVVFYNFRR